MEINSNKKRLTKNTVFLYLRTLFLLLISLYTSRVVLDVLGIDDFGIYNVVGGFVAMFSIVSSSLTTSITRYLTFELGRNDLEKLKKVFSTSVTIQILMAVAIIVIAEILGTWYLNNKINIPEGRLEAAYWVFHCSLLTFAINLISVPYNASIISHEKMDIFAYISILDGVLKLFIVYLLVNSPIDKLIAYVFLLLCESIVIRLFYGVYCKRNFDECNYQYSIDKNLFKEMFGFSGWNFFLNASWILNTQGVNLMINFFFGVGVNAARGIATQVQTAVMNFVGNFMTAINPQITKAYASGNNAYLNSLITQGAKYVFFMFLAFAFPIVLETGFVLSLWLKQVPSHAAIFIQLSFITSLFDSFGNTGYYACVAGGNLKPYLIRMVPMGFLVFPLSWIAFGAGAPPESAYVIFGIISFLTLFVRLLAMKDSIGYKPMDFIVNAFIPSMMTGIVASIPPLFLLSILPYGWLRFMLVLCCCELSLGLSIYTIGLKKVERDRVNSYLIRYFKNKF